MMSRTAYPAFNAYRIPASLLVGLLVVAWLAPASASAQTPGPLPGGTEKAAPLAFTADVIDGRLVAEPFSLTIPLDGVDVRSLVGVDHDEYRHVETERLQMSSAQDQVTWELSISRPGSFTLSSLKLQWIDLEGTLHESPLSTITVDVESVLAEDDDLMLAAAGALRALLQSRIVQIIIATTMVTGFVAFLALFLTRRMRGSALEQLPPPIDEAREALRRLAESPLWTDAAASLAYVRLSAILKRYLSRELDMPASEMTTLELRRFLPHTTVSAQSERIVFLLHALDRVKFAGEVPTEDQRDLAMEDTKSAIELVARVLEEQRALTEATDVKDKPAGTSSATHATESTVSPPAIDSDSAVDGEEDDFRTKVAEDTEKSWLDEEPGDSSLEAETASHDENRPRPQSDGDEP